MLKGPKEKRKAWKYSDHFRNDKLAVLMEQRREGVYVDMYVQGGVLNQ